MVTLHVVGNKVDLRPLETVLADRKSPDRGKAEAGNLVYLVQKNLEDSPMDFCAEAPLIYFLVKLAVGAYAQKGPLHRAAILGRVVWNIAQKFELEVPFVRTVDNLADFFTKPVKSATQFHTLRKAIMNESEP